ncbi:glycosyltransferase involved in cell wall biosynthesis [Peribacillus deserti]|uniref:Glycosyltransferase involved in cell wall biosynthesis n=1 Tax=Peribacillus deserti TaxID=673318 RepID=A0ABS2QDK4_9BACI|nr:glycosyltransferase family 4 protein [Peribacillus deserti]MBM7691246.1 glycosyltransferase involved in cell wall biosynthesis [Peribacillus deserti]
MKILLATFWIVPHVGGVWKYMEQLKGKLESMGHSVDLMGYGEGQSFVHVVNEHREFRRNNLDPTMRAQLNVLTRPSLSQDPVVKFYEHTQRFYELGIQHLGLGQYDVIHTQDVFSTACMNRVKPEGTTLVASIHGCAAHELKHHVTHVNKTPTSHLACQYFDETENEGATAAVTTIVANEWLKNIFTNEFHVPEAQIKILHYGYETDLFLKRMSDNSEIERPIDKKVIIYAGRLAELKGVHHLITALGQLKKIRNDWVCWIVGDGDKAAQLINQSKSSGLDQDIIFFGSRDDIPYLLSISDIFVLPSLLENQPLAVIEAQIAGKAVVVSDAGGLPEIVEHGNTGVITPAGDPSSLCMHINYLLTHENYMKNLGIRAQKWGLEHWSLDKAVNRIVEVYQCAIKEHKIRFSK